MKTRITLSQAIEGYLLDTRARQLSQKTILDYQNGFRHFRNYIGDSSLSEISTNDIRRFLADLGSRPVKPAGVATRPTRVLSNKSILNIHIALSALWTWVIAERFVTEHIVRAVKPPAPEAPAIRPFSKADVEAMLTACERPRPYSRPGKQKCGYNRPTAVRDRAIILVLLDTGTRASEVCLNPRLKTCGLLIKDYNQRNLTVHVTGKGGKERIILISHRTSKAIWRYLLTRPDAGLGENLFLSIHGEPLTNSGLLQLIRRLGRNASIPDAHPHRFRHTFAINLLRNGANALELQRMLGHSTLDMVKRYVDIAQVDVENAHRRASPMANWRL